MSTMPGFCRTDILSSHMSRILQVWAFIEESLDRVRATILILQGPDSSKA